MTHHAHRATQVALVHEIHLELEWAYSCDFGKASGSSQVMQAIDAACLLDGAINGEGEVFFRRWVLSERLVDRTDVSSHLFQEVGGKERTALVVPTPRRR